jgi:hypothetical protein
MMNISNLLHSGPSLSIYAAYSGEFRGFGYGSNEEVYAQSFEQTLFSRSSEVIDGLCAH